MTQVDPANPALEKTPELIIKPLGGWRAIDFRELWTYRELLYFLVWREIKVRYKQTILGAAWAIIQPFFTMVVFSVFFGTLAGVPSDGIPYPIFTYSALLPWQMFENGIRKAATSLVSGRNLLTKVYFPRITVPLAPILASFIDFLLAFVVLIGMMFYYDMRPTQALWTLPLFLILTMVTAIGVSLWTAALNVAYRDVGYLIPFILRVWFFITPITYASSIVPEQYQLLYSLNPMVGVVEGFRWAMLGVGNPPSSMFLGAVVISFLLMITGAMYFRRMERTFADVV